MDEEPQGPRLPDGVDEDGYKRIRGLMRASVLNVWRARHEVIAGIDPWDVVDEAWTSMADGNFQSKGPFVPHALVVARNKAVDALRRAEARRGDRSLDAVRPSDDDVESTALHDKWPGSPGADVAYFRELDHLAAIQRLTLVEKAVYATDVLNSVERQVLLAVRVDGKSRAAVGRELDPPLTGQRVGQIAAEALMKVQAYVKANEQMAMAESGGMGEVE